MSKEQYNVLNIYYEKTMRLYLPITFLITLFLCSLPTIVLGQDQEQRQWLQEFAQQQEAEWMQERQRVIEFAEQYNIPVRQEFEDGRVVIEIQRIEDGLPVYNETHNRTGAITSSVDAVWPGGHTGLYLTGQGITLGIWDGGGVRTTHQEFGNRVTQIDEPDDLSNHATHVAGTMVAAGVNPDAQGMSHEAELLAHDWNNDQAEMAHAAVNGLIVSNHSYGRIMGWRFNDEKEIWQWWGDSRISETEDYRYGFYSDLTRDWDQIAYNAPNYLIIKSAGNSRSQGPGDQPVEHLVWDFDAGGEWVVSEQKRDLDGGQDGYQSVAGRAVAKNVFSVGAVEPIEGGYQEPQDVKLAEFSSSGPTNDGRIKPEIVAQGIDVYSLSSLEDNDYYRSNGTSMSSPIVSGTVGLLQQLYQNLFGDEPLASTIRALLIHTTHEAGYNEGPDYMYGWGLMNAEGAAETLRNSHLGGRGDHINELTINDGDTYEYEFYSDGEEPIKATISWTDLPGESLEPQLNPEDLMLVNDLDLRIIGPNGEEYKPYVLDPLNPDQPASTGDNFRDNTEQVYIESPVEGDYYVQVTHKDNLEGGSQVFSLVVSGEQVHAPQFTTSGPFALTSSGFVAESDLDEVVDTLMGSNYRVADWNDLVRYHEDGNDLREMLDDLGVTERGTIGSVTRDGSRQYSSWRYYYASRHDHERPSHYLAHENIDNYLVSLGSWYGDSQRRVLAYDKTYSQEDSLITVWPGDTNNDGEVNGADLLPIGRYYGQELGKENNPGTSWEPHERQPWPADGDEPARVYADANGDGIIDARDVLALGLNYGETRESDDSDQGDILASAVAASAGLSASESDAEQDGELIIELLEDAHEQGRLHLAVDGGAPGKYMYGLSLKIYVEADSEMALTGYELHEQTSELGGDLLVFSKQPEKSNFIDIALSNTSGDGFSGRGRMLELDVMHDAMPGDVVSIHLQDMQAISSDGSPIVLQADSLGYRIGQGSITGIEPGETPDSYMLTQNYPNPFNPVTQISYGLPQTEHVRLDVYDALGRHVTTLVNTHKDAGYHTVSFDASHLSSGMYVYRIVAGGFTKTRVMMLVK